MRSFVSALLCALLLMSVLLAGCAHVSPAVGTWSGQQGPVVATLTLKEDGTGSLGAPPFVPTTPVKWTVSKDNPNDVKITSVNPKKATSGKGLPAIIDKEGKTMSLNVGGMSATLTKQPDSK